MSTAQEDFLDAIRESDVDLNHIRTLMDSPDVDLDAAFHIVMEEGYSDLVPLFLAHPSVDPTMDNNFALLYVTDARSDTETLALFLADGRIDPTFNDNYALKAVILNDSNSSLKLMLSDKRVNPDTPVTKENRRFLNDINVTIKLDHILDDIAGEVDNENGGLRDMPENETLQAILDEFNEYFANYATHALSKEKIKKKAGDMRRAAVLGGKLPNNLIKHVGTILTGNNNVPGEIPNILEGLKGNYYGPIRQAKKKRATRSRRRSSSLTRKNKRL